jgi:hypothetical protein
MEEQSFLFLLILMIFYFFKVPLSVDISPSVVLINSAGGNNLTKQFEDVSIVDSK